MDGLLWPLICRRAALLRLQGGAHGVERCAGIGPQAAPPGEGFGGLFHEHAQFLLGIIKSIINDV